VVGTANALRDYFTTENFKPDSVVVNRWQAGGQAGRLCAAGRQIDAQPAGIEPAGADPLSQDQL
jgi:hypothetical protein